MGTGRFKRGPEAGHPIDLSTTPEGAQVMATRAKLGEMSIKQIPAEASRPKVEV